MEFSSSKFVFAAPDIVWRPSAEAGAALYMMGREILFVLCGSPREEEVCAAGAVRVGTLRFDRDLTERSHRRPIRSVIASELADACFTS